MYVYAVEPSSSALICVQKLSYALLSLNIQVPALRLIFLCQFANADTLNKPFCVVIALNISTDVAYVKEKNKNKRERFLIQQ